MARRDESATPARLRSPVRTCVGCRRRAAAAELLRVVVAPPATVVPDPARRMPGRGASLHPDPSCLALAVRRGAFGRALRVNGVQGVVDIGPVREYVAMLGAACTGGTGSTVGSAGGVGTPPAPTEGK